MAWLAFTTTKRVHQSLHTRMHTRTPFSFISRLEWRNSLRKCSAIVPCVGLDGCTNRSRRACPKSNPPCLHLGRAYCPVVSTASLRCMCSQRVVVKSPHYPIMLPVTCARIIISALLFFFCLWGVFGFFFLRASVLPHFFSCVYQEQKLDAGDPRTALSSPVMSCHGQDNIPSCHMLSTKS